MPHIGKKRTTVTVLVTDWGEWPCPPDLVKLWDAAPKIPISRTSWEPGEPDYNVLMPDPKTPAGKAYYARERELLQAVNVIETSGTMRVVAAKDHGRD